MTIPFELDLNAVFAAPDPLSELAVAHERGWVARSPAGLHVTTFEAAMDLLRDRRFETNADVFVDGAGLSDPVVRQAWKTALIGAEPVDHDRMRKLMTPYFTRRTVAGLSEYVADLLGRLVDRVAGEPSVDAVSQLFEPIPPAVFARMVGAPEADAEQIGQWSATILQIFARDPSLASIIETTQRELMVYVDDFIEAKRHSPGGADLISALLSASENGDRLSAVELRSLVVEVLEASTDNTTSALSSLLYAAALNPDRWVDLRADPSLIPGFIEEVGRMWPRTVHASRTALTDVEWRGLHIEKGSQMYVVVPSAMRDPSMFDEPDVFDPTREYPSVYNLNYGGGVHQCLGVSLARMEMVTALEVLAARWKHVEFASEPTISCNFGVTTIERLPLSLTAA